MVGGVSGGVGTSLVAGVGDGVLDFSRGGVGDGVLDISRGGVGDGVLDFSCPDPKGLVRISRRRSGLASSCSFGPPDQICGEHGASG